MSRRAAGRAAAWWEWGRRSGGLFATAFLVSIANGILSVAQPDKMHHLAAGDAETGRLGGLQQGFYLVGLLFLWPAVSRRGLRNILMCGLGGLACTTLSMGLCGDRLLMQWLASTHGLLACLLWPPLMGWVATGVSGKSLSRRLGAYSITWSTGLVVGPIAGGLLVKELGLWPAFLTATLCTAGAWTCISLMRPPEDAFDPLAAGDPAPATPTAPPPGSPAHADSAAPSPATVAFFVSASRWANVAGYVAAGLARWQFPALKKHLDLDPTVFGAVLMAVNLAMAIGFLVLRRTAFWHHRFGFLLGAQSLLFGAVLSLWWVDSAWHMALAGTLAGFGTAATYYCSVYHGAAGGGRPENAMAVHETVLSVGFIAGSVGGGWISEHADQLVPGADLRLTYPVAAGVLAALVLVQLVLWTRRRAEAAAATHSAPAPARVGN